MHSEDTRVLAAIRWVAIPVRIEDTLIEIPHSLPADWRRLPAPPSTRELGSRWVAEARSVVLRVPSAVVDGEFNYLLTPVTRTSPSSNSRHLEPSHSIPG